MPPTILSSPLLDLGLINKFLSNPNLEACERINLLGLKIHILTNRTASQAVIKPSASTSSLSAPAFASTSASASTSILSSPPSSASTLTPTAAPPFRPTVPLPIDETIEELNTRSSLSRAYLDLRPPDWISAESELSVIEKRSKALLKKRTKREGESTKEDMTEYDRAQTQHDQREVNPPWFADLRNLRREALKQLVLVEEGLGRDGRAKRWKEQLSILDMEETER